MRRFSTGVSAVHATTTTATDGATFASGASSASGPTKRCAALRASAERCLAAGVTAPAHRSTTRTRSGTEAERAAIGRSAAVGFERRVRLGVETGPERDRDCEYPDAKGKHGSKHVAQFVPPCFCD